MLKRLLNRLFSTKPQASPPAAEGKEIVLFSLEMDTSAGKSIEDYVQLHATGAADVERLAQLGGCLRLQFQNDRLVRLLEVDEFEEDERPIRPHLKGLKWREYPAHQLCYWVPETEPEGATAYLGGTPPADFTIPFDEEIAVPFQYIGKLVPTADWRLPFERLHLVYPLFATIGGYLFLDYSDENKPVVLDGFELIEHAFGNCVSGTTHHFEQVPLRLLSIKDVEDEDLISFSDWHYGYAGLPNWVQYPQIPYCPKTGHLMEFVGQFDTFGEIPTAESDLVFDGDYFELYSKHLNFWGDGCLFVFVCPASKVVGYLIQNT